MSPRAKVKPQATYANGSRTLARTTESRNQNTIDLAWLTVTRSYRVDQWPKMQRLSPSEIVFLDVFLTILFLIDICHFYCSWRHVFVDV